MPALKPERQDALAPLPFWRRDGFCALLLFLATVAAYQHVWGAGFIWDDEMHVTQNPCIVGPLGLMEIWTTRAARYFPLVLTTFWAEHAIWGLKPLPYHLVNVLLHASCAMVLWRVLRVLRVRGALLGAALWALHPVQAESVAWVTELKNTQSCLFYLLTVLFFVKWVAGNAEGTARNPRAYGWALLFAALAMASKSSTVVLPVILALCAWWTLGSLRARTLASLVPVALMSVAASALSLWTQNLEGANAPEWKQGLLGRAAVAGMNFWFYLGKLAWPHPLIFIYPRWNVEGSRVASYLPTAGMGALLLFLWWKRHGRLRPAFLAFGSFFVALIPVLGLLDQYFWRYSFVGDHFQYLASIGPLALAGAGLAVGWEHLGARGGIVKPVCCGALLAVLGVLTWRQCAIYKDVETLWRSTIALNPGCWMAYNNLGSTYMESGRLDEAAAQFRKAVDVRPDDVEAHVNLALALSRMGRLDEAMVQDRKALEIDPRYETAHNALGDALLQAGHTDEAIDQFKAALAIRPNFPEAEINYGNAALRIGRVEEAMAHYRKALAIDPHNAEAHSNLGSALLGMGRTQEASGQYEEALTLNPDFPTALVNLGNVRLQAGQTEAAAALYLRALKSAPNVAEAHNGLGVALQQEGRLDEAVAQFRKALEINPGNPQAHQNLGNALSKLGRMEEADAQFLEASRAR
jgi:tetratricopeptide (TPR) repeat protein